MANSRRSSTGKVRPSPLLFLVLTRGLELVPLGTLNHASTAYIATFVQSQSGLCFRRKHTSSLFIPPEGFHILDDIVVTFIYFESKWQDKEGAKSHLSFFGGL